MVVFPEAVVFGVLALFLALPVFWAWRFVGAYLFRRSDSQWTDAALPPVAVILPLRGADPFLCDCLRGLLNQDYPYYTVRIVIDGPDDPAWGVVERILSERRRPPVEVRVSALRRPLATCTLKVSAQIQAVSELEGHFEVVALIDADAHPARNWLRSLVAPLADPRVGAVTSNRWFAPREMTWGSLVRRLWNAASVTQMYAFDIPWGGSLALRTVLFREAGLLRRWQRCFCDDSGVGAALRERGLRLGFAPGATMINRESIDLKNCCRFIRRQLLCPRLDLGWWPLILVANAGLLLALGTAVALVVAGLWTGTPQWVAWSGGLLAFHLGGLLIALTVEEALIGRIVRERGQEPPPLTLSWKLVFALPLTCLVQLGCLVSALRVRRVNWRGVTYHIHGPGKLHLLEYRPFRPAGTLPDAGKSII